MPKTYPKLNFPPINLKVKPSEDGKGLLVWCSSRGCYLTLTPEEWVRRHLVEYLVSKYELSVTQIVEEYPVNLNGQPQRADLVVVSGSRPLILAECKASEVKITRATLDQAVRYNSVVGARYVILTNGVTHLCFEFSGDGYVPLRSFPEGL